MGFLLLDFYVSKRISACGIVATWVSVSMWVNLQCLWDIGYLSCDVGFSFTWSSVRTISGCNTVATWVM